MGKEGKRYEGERSARCDEIHPDFRVIFEHPGQVPVFAYNKVDWKEMRFRDPEIKLIFAFDDPYLLDECPYLTKVALDAKWGYKYFGVAYGWERQTEELAEYGERFNFAQILNYEGTVVIREVK